MRAYIDSDVLIWHLRGHVRALGFWRQLVAAGSFELWTGALQRAEVVFFMRPPEEEATLLLLSQVKTASVDQAVVDLGGKLYRQWHPSHGIDVNDAMLAATVQLTGGKVFCLNTKHYPMKDLAVERAWE